MCLHLSAPPVWADIHQLGTRTWQKFLYKPKRLREPSRPFKVPILVLALRDKLDRKDTKADI